MKADQLVATAAATMADPTFPDRGCIDKWLKRNKVCPLCLQESVVLYVSNNSLFQQMQFLAAVFPVLLHGGHYQYQYRQSFSLL